MDLNILVLPGDGIGAEVTGEAALVLRHVAEKWGHRLNVREGLLGGVAIHKTGTPFPEETERLAAGADATLLGAGGLPAVNTMTYTRAEIARVTRMAFHLARGRRKKVTSVDKSNVLENSQLWRRVVTEVAREYPEVELDHMLVDNCAMQLILNPRRFDVVLTENMFGDILSDEGAVLAGSIGMLPSASIGDRRPSGA